MTMRRILPVVFLTVPLPACQDTALSSEVSRQNQRSDISV